MGRERDREGLHRVLGDRVGVDVVGGVHGIKGAWGSTGLSVNFGGGSGDNVEGAVGRCQSVNGPGG